MSNRDITLSQLTGTTEGNGEEKAQAYLNEYKPDQNTFFQALGNIKSSATQLGHDILTPFLHPVQTAKSMKDLGSSVVSLIRPGEQGNEQLAKEVGNFFVQRYGSLDNIKKTFATDPVGMLSDVAIILTGGGALAAKAPGVVGQTAKIVGTVGKTIDPINVAAKGTKLASKVVTKPAEAIVGMTTGAGGEAISQAVKAGKAGGEAGEAFVSNLRGMEKAEDVVGDAFSAMKKISEESKGTYKTNLLKLKLNKVPVKFSKITDEINKFRRSKMFEGESTLSLKAQKKLESIDKIIANWKANKKLHNAKGLDMLKRRIDAEYPTGIQVGDSGVVVAEIRNLVKNQILKEVPDYAKVMKAYEKAITFERQMMKELSLGNKTAAGTTLRKLQSVMRNNVNTNFGQRLDYVKVLEGVTDKNIMSKLAGQSLSSWTPRGIQGLGAGSVAAYGAFVDPTLLAGLAFQSPRLMGEAAYKLGQGANIAGKVPVVPLSQSARAAGLLSNQALEKRGLLQ